MKRWMLIAGVMIAGVILAILLFPRPDTGIATPPSTASGPTAEVGAHAPATARKGPIGRPGMERVPVLPNGPSPIALENIKRLSLPEALYAGRLTSPLAVVRRQLQLTGDPAADALGKDADVLIGGLREQRRDPESHDLGAQITASREWLARVKASPWGAQPDVAPQFDRFEQLVAEYENAKANPHMPVPPPGSVSPPMPPVEEAP